MLHGTDGFTSPPKEGMLWIFRQKNATAMTGFEPAILGTRGQHANHYTIKVASKRNKYLEHFLGVKAVGAYNRQPCVDYLEIWAPQLPGNLTIHNGD
jgi:hypothetical protein